MDKWIYIGIFLDEVSKKRLKKMYPTPDGWKEFYDHMTVVFNDGTDIANAVKSINEANLNKKFKLKVVGPGISDKAFAVQVKIPKGVVSANKITHITLATSPEGSAVDSNYITNWSTLHEDLFITGTMKVFEPVPVRGLLGIHENMEPCYNEANVY